MSRNGRLAFSGTGSSGRSSFTATGNVDGRTCVSISRVKLLQSMAASSKDAANRCAVILCRKGAKTKVREDALDCEGHFERRDCPMRAVSAKRRGCEASAVPTYLPKSPRNGWPALWNRGLQPIFG